MSKQITLGPFGFTKSFTHRGNEATVEILLVTPGISTEKNLECYVCHERFCSN